MVRCHSTDRITYGLFLPLGSNHGVPLIAYSVRSYQMEGAYE
jgi:hypothetical protein